MQPTERSGDKRRPQEKDAKGGVADMKINTCISYCKLPFYKRGGEETRDDCAGKGNRIVGSRRRMDKQHISFR